MPICLPSFAGVVGAPSIPFNQTLSVFFDGSDDYMTTTLSTQIFSGDFTLSFWGRPVASSHAYCTVMQLGGYSGGFRLYRYPPVIAGTAGRFAWWKGAVGSGYNSIFGNFGSSAADTWFNMTIIRSGTAMTAYLNGSQVATQDNSHSAQSYTSTAWDISFTQYPYDGRIDELALWDSALSTSDISALYSSKGDARFLSPNNYWRMGDGTGDTDSGGGTPASGDTVGTIVDQGDDGNNLVGSNGNPPLFSDIVP